MVIGATNTSHAMCGGTGVSLVLWRQRDDGRDARPTNSLVPLALLTDEWRPLILLDGERA